MSPRRFPDWQHGRRQDDRDRPRAGLVGVCALLLVASLVGGCQFAEEPLRAVDGAGDPSDDAAGSRASRSALSTQKEPPPARREVDATPSAAPADTSTPSGGAERGATKQSRRRLVARVVDGDTVELDNGQDVRLVGIDTPERGECGFDAATTTLARLVEGERVRLTRPAEDRDRYGRLLRYLDVGDVDPGLRLIESGLAIARYDSRDGYGYHPREPRYVAADDARANLRCAAPAPEPAPAPRAPQPGAGCASGYSPCVPVHPPDVNCPDVNGPVRVTGSDPHGLDADGDGVACE